MLIAAKCLVFALLGGDFRRNVGERDADFRFLFARRLINAPFQRLLIRLLRKTARLLRNLNVF